MKIGTLTLKNAIFLAPLAGVSDHAFRVLCAQAGAGLVYTEMVSAKAIAYNNQKTMGLLKRSPEIETVGVQLFGRDPELMAESARKINQEGIALFDINLGCPVPKVVKNGEGSALLKEPKLVGRIIESMVKAVKQPVTIKIRAGFYQDDKNAVEIGKIAEASGATAIGIHGRTREDYYNGQADWKIIRQLKEAVKIPVLGNGDIYSALDAQRMLEETGCDGVLIGRGARGNPWIFSEILTYFETGVLPKRPTTEAIIQMIKKHMILLQEDKGVHIAVREIRKHIGWYTKGLPHATILRGKINQIQAIDQVEAILRETLGMN